MNAVRSVASGVARAGLPRLAWRMRRVRRQPGRALVLMYHRVAQDADYPVCCIPPAVFDAQLDLLTQRMRVLPLHALVERLQGAPLVEDVAAITFDDGYRDNLDTALPILQRHGLPATLFVTSGFIDGTARPVGDRLLDAFEALWRQAIDSRGWSPAAGRLDQLISAALVRPGSLAAVSSVESQLKKTPAAQAEEAVAALERFAGCVGNGRSPMLNWDGVRRLLSAGIEIASHTVSHPVLSRLPLDRAEHELRASKERIEAEINRPVVGFAFPNGHRGDFTRDHVALLRRIGYLYACTAEWGGNRPGCDAFDLRRIGVGRDTPALLDLKLALAGAAQPCAA